VSWGTGRRKGNGEQEVDVKIIRSIQDMQALASRHRLQARSVGFVPTMGALHEGHRALIRRARAENDVVIVSIFVNPTQFGPGEDFRRYPRRLASDREMIKQEDVDVLFMPSAEAMFPAGFGTWVELPTLTQVLCGPRRPGHFRGVATVVAKLLEITRPTRAYFGEKDYQQLRVISQMVEDLNLPVHIIACGTVRERDGLACSSRNTYLSRDEREEAVKLYQALYLGRELVERRIMTNSRRLEKRLRQVLSTIRRGKIDYISVVDPLTLSPMKKIRRPALLAAAIWIGRTRLIDNVMIS
jgi:pantoate--beta-alanine ligase